MQFLIEKYKEAHPGEGHDIAPHLVAEWAIKEGLWRPAPITPQEQLRRLLSRCLRETYVLDPQGREVRANLPILEEVVTRDGLKYRSRWYPIFEAPANVARQSFALRRRSALADVRQLHFDFLSYNDNNILGEQLEPMDYNFEKDIAELSEPTTYQEGPIIGDDEEDEEIT